MARESDAATLSSEAVGLDLNSNPLRSTSFKQSPFSSRAAASVIS